MTEIDVFGNVIKKVELPHETKKEKEVLTEDIKVAPEKEVIEEVVEAKRGRKKKTLEE